MSTEQAAVRPVEPRADAAALLAGLVTVAFWGSAFVADPRRRQIGLAGSVALGRLLVSLVVLALAAAIWRESLPVRRDLVLIAAFGVLLLGVYSFTLNEAERRIDRGGLRGPAIICELGTNERSGTMNHVGEMLTAHPQATPSEALVRCIEECYACVVACTACADADLAEEDVEDLKHCIGLDLDCADVCEVTGRVLTRQTSPDPRLTRSVLEACLEACRLCAEECEHHADHHEHCRLCAETCRRCEESCANLLRAMS